MQVMHDKAADEDVLVDTSKLQLHKAGTGVLAADLDRETPGNSHDSGQGDRPSCLSDQSKSDFRPPRNPQTSMHERPPTPHGHKHFDQFQDIFHDGDVDMLHGIFGPGSSGGSGRLSPGMGLGLGSWDAGDPAAAALALLMPEEGSPPDAPPRVTLTLGSVSGAAIAKALDRAAAAERHPDKVQQGVTLPAATVNAAASAPQQAEGLPTHLPPAATRQRGHSPPAPLRLPALRAHPDALWPAAATHQLTSFELPDLPHPDLLRSHLGSDSLGGRRGGSSDGRSSLGRPPSLDSDDPFGGLLPDGLELEPMDAELETFASQPLPEEHLRLHAGSLLASGLTAERRRRQPDVPPLPPPQAGDGARHRPGSRRASAPSAQHPPRGLLHHQDGWAVGGGGPRLAAPGSWAPRQPMHTARRQQGQPASNIHLHSRGGGGSGQRVRPPPAWQGGSGGGGGARDSGGSEGGTPKSATNADIPQRPRSQRTAGRGAKRTRQVSEQPSDSGASGGSPRAPRSKEDQANCKRRKNREAAQRARDRRAEQKELLDADNAAKQAAATRKEARLAYLLAEPAQLLQQMEAEECIIRRALGALRLQQGHRRDVSQLQAELAMLHRMVPKELRRRAQARREAAEAARAGPIRSAFAAAAEEGFQDEPAPAWHGMDAAVGPGLRWGARSGGPPIGSPTRSMPPPPRPQGALPRGGQWHSPTRSDSVAHGDRLANGRRARPPGLPPTGQTWSAAAPPSATCGDSGAKAARLAGSPLRRPASATSSRGGFVGLPPPGASSPAAGTDVGGYGAGTRSRACRSMSGGYMQRGGRRFSSVSAPAPLMGLDHKMAMVAHMLADTKGGFDETMGLLNKWRSGPLTGCREGAGPGSGGSGGRHQRSAAANAGGRIDQRRLQAAGDAVGGGQHFRAAGAAAGASGRCRPTARQLDI